ncbi:MAG: chorismate mutase [Alphaproteobacteria bacterium]|nr:chorismate mutase [Alphaproteobacteria bacterium]
MNDSGTTLDDLRRDIDSIDAEMHALIIRRAALVDRIRAVKSRDSIAPIRPGREALILRRLASKHNGGFPFGAIARIWREIIAGITRMEKSDYAVAVFATGENPSYWDLARNAFGSATPMTAFGSVREVVGEVIEKKVTLGVLPFPREGDSDPWWTGLTAPDGPRVSYRLPMSPIADNNGAAALALGYIVPEASGGDKTLIVLETAETVSRTGLAAMLERVAIKGQPHASLQQGAWFHLLEADGFIELNDPRLEDLGRLSGVEGCSVIGAYATPIDGAEAQGSMP